MILGTVGGTEQAIHVCRNKVSKAHHEKNVTESSEFGERFGWSCKIISNKQGAVIEQIKQMKPLV